MKLLKKISGSIRSKRSGKKFKGPLTVGSISLAGSCFSQELDNGKRYDIDSLASHQIGNSLDSVYSSEYNLTSSSASNGSSSDSSTGGTSRSSSMVTSSSCPNMLTPSPSETSLDLKAYLEDHSTLYMGKHGALQAIMA